MKRILSAMLAVVVMAGLVACGGGDANNANGNTPADNQSENQPDKPAPKIPEKIIVTAIPDDSDEGRMRENFGYIAKLFEKETGIPCEYMHVQDYAASVTALATGNAHVAWFGAVTVAQAYLKMEDDLVIVGCRDIDKTFISYYIGNAEAGVPKVKDLAELAKLAKDNGWTLTYGSKSSTSSHMMPRSFFTQQAKMKPEEAFKAVAYSGKHEIVAAKVASGEFHVGALGQPPYDRLSDEDKAKAPIIYTTPTFMNYCFAARADMGDELVGKLRKALLNAHETEEGKKNLSYLKAKKYVEANMDEWMSYVDLLESGVDIGG
jgi:phosphonate transport system substrate-binding protein